MNAPCARPTALIAEDEPMLARTLAGQLAGAWPALDIVATVHDGDAAADALQRLAPAFAFLDIRMPGRNGLQAARAAPPGTGIVFVTAYDQYAVDAFDQAAVDYLLKPVTAERLARCVERLQARWAARGAAAKDAAEAARGGTDPALLARLDALLAAQPPRLRFLRASLGDVIRQIPVDEVLYLEARDKYVNVVTADAQALVRMSLAELVQQLDPQRFAQIHRSTIVNLDAIDSLRRDFAGRLFVHLRRRSERLPVGRSFAAQFKAL